MKIEMNRSRWFTIAGLVVVLGIFTVKTGSTKSRHVDSRTALDGKKYKVAVARFSHETCTFCPGGDPGIEDWTHAGPPHAGAEVFRASSYMRGFVAEAREFGDIELVGLRSPRGV